MSTYPGPFVQLDSEPSLKAPVLIAAFEGWNDAGDAASIAARYLRDSWGGDPLGAIDPEEFYDFSTTRPWVTIGEDRKRRIDWPETHLWSGSIDSERDAIVVLGSEPQLRWRTFCQQVLSVADRFEVERVITLGALLTDAPHSRPTPVFGSSDNLEVAEEFGLEVSQYEGPTGIVGILNAECSQAGLDVMSLWAAVPSYLPGVASPKAAKALVDRLSPILNTVVDTADLDAGATAYVRQADALVAEDDDTANYVIQLEEHHDAEDGLSQVDPQAMVAELEQFLKNQES
ncbi:MAG: PAC2 family protein [Acidimicrobiales bacterium]